MDLINQSEVNVTLNTTFNMTCNVDSYPPAMVHWEVDGDQVSNDTLLIVDTSVPGAIVTYACVAVNEVNGANRSASNSINVIIQGSLLCDIYVCTTNYLRICTYVDAYVYILYNQVLRVIKIATKSDVKTGRI